MLRSDLHKLCDLGYITVDPEKKTIVVSPRICDEYENGREDYALQTRSLAQAQNSLAIPSLENLRYHAEHVFRS
jgi:putative restriction endonuclease